MVKYVLLNINSILNNVRNNLTDIFFCCCKIKNAALLLYMEVKRNE